MLREPIDVIGLRQPTASALAPTYRDTVRSVLDRVRDLNGNQLLQYTYGTYPMVSQPRGSRLVLPTLALEARNLGLTF